MLTRFLFVIYILFTVNAFAQSDSGLVAHWTFNGTLADATGKGHNGGGLRQGSLAPEPYILSYTVGSSNIPNTAVLLNDTLLAPKEMINTSYQPDVNMNKYSICATVKPKAYYSGCSAQIILGQLITNNNAAGIYGLQLSTYAYDSLCTTGDTAYTFFGRGVYNYKYKPWQYSPTNASENWHKVVLTFDSLQYKVYVDGVLKTTVPIQGYLFGQPNTWLQIGGATSYSPNIYTTTIHSYFRGAIDDIKVYNRVLDSAEVTTYGQQVQDTLVYITQPFLDTNMCLHSSYDIHYKTQRSFLPGNTFTVQLSDANGNFSNAMNIGSATADTTGIIPISIPASIPTGNAYRIRIVSSAPVRVSYDNGTNISIGNTKPSKPIVSTNNPICYSGNLVMTAASTPGNVQYRWYRPSPAGYLYVTDTTQSINKIASYGDAGLYVIRTILNGCASDTTQLSITVNFKSYTSISKPITGFHCIRDTLHLNVVNPDPTYTYYWYDHNGMQLDTGANAAIYLGPQFLTNQKIYAVGTNTFGCESTDTVSNFNLLNPKTFTINNIGVVPGNGIVAGDTAKFFLSAQPSGSKIFYQWQKNGTDIPGATSITYQTNNIQTGDIFSLKVANKDSCIYPDTVISNSITMQVSPVSVSSLYTNNFSIYPNPNNGSFVISVDGLKHSKGQVVIMNTIGQKVYENVVIIKDGNLKENITLNGIPAGIYIAIFTAGEETYHIPLTVN